MAELRTDTRIYFLMFLLLCLIFAVTRVRFVMALVIPDSSLNDFLRYLDEGNKYNCSYSGHAGGQKVCLDPPFRPKINQSLVYSFGNVYDFSFEDSAANRYGATVRSFDKSLGYSRHKRPSKRGEIQFYPTGLIGSSEDRKFLNSKYNYSTLEALHGSLDQHGPIDYMRVDIDGLEWSVLEDINTYESIRLSAKQISFQLHTKHAEKCKLGAQCDADYGRYQWILDSIRTNGFHIWHYDVTKFCIPSYKIHCVNAIFVNTRFAKK